MARIQILADEGSALDIIETAIASEIQHLKIGLDNTQRRIADFERKYGSSSDEFLSRTRAEDLGGGDEEYVTWIGELKIRERIIENIEKLQNIEYAAR
jgi:hypothetical protein